MEENRAIGLYERSLAGQWNADKDVNWKQTIKLDPAVEAPLKRIINELYWSERESLWTVKRMNTPIRNYFKDHYFSMCAAAHTFDESRHVYVLERYLKKIDGLGECPTLWKTITKVADMTGASVTNYFYSILVSETLGEVTFYMMRKSDKVDPLLRKISENCLRDESRHIGYLTEALRRIHPRLGRIAKLRHRWTLKAMIYFGLRSLKRTAADGAAIGIDQDEYLDYFERKLIASIRRAGVEEVLRPDEVSAIVARFHNPGWTRVDSKRDEAAIASLHALEEGSSDRLEIPAAVA